MNVPILDLKRQYQAIKPEVDAAIERVLVSGRFILGPEVETFEQEIAKYCGVNHAIGVASGTDALLLSLRALGIGPGDKVILPSFTFFATAGVVHNVGATPVFVDIDPKTYNIDSSEVKRLLATDHLLPTEIKAIIPVHLYGQMADMDPIMEIASEYDLGVVEDAAQAIGASYRSRSLEDSPRATGHKLFSEPDVASPQATSHSPLAHSAGSIGDLGCFSFFPTKNLGAYGDGGMVITNDDELAERVRILRAHGSKLKYYHQLVGVNSRLDAIQAAILRVKLTHLSKWTAARQRVADRYEELLRGVDGAETPYRAPDRSHIFHQYTIRVKNGRRDALQQHLKKHGIGTSIYYPLPLHLQECFQDLGYKEGNLPISEEASREVLSLPMFPELTEDEQDYLVRAIRVFMKTE